MHLRCSWPRLVPPASLLLSGCIFGDSEVAVIDPSEVPTSITVLLRNTEVPIAGNSVHLLGPGEALPCCRLDPGADRTFTLQMRTNETFLFKAMRNGDQLGAVTCRWTDKQATGVRVEWTGSTLKCTNGWSAY